MDIRDSKCKTASEIGDLAAMLTVSNQAYVLNTINALLFSQQVNGCLIEDKTKKKPM